MKKLLSQRVIAGYAAGWMAIAIAGCGTSTVPESKRVATATQGSEPVEADAADSIAAGSNDSEGSPAGGSATNAPSGSDVGTAAAELLPLDLSPSGYYLTIDAPAGTIVSRSGFNAKLHGDGYQLTIDEYPREIAKSLAERKSFNCEILVQDDDAVMSRWPAPGGTTRYFLDCNVKVGEKVYRCYFDDDKVNEAETRRILASARTLRQTAENAELAAETQETEKTLHRKSISINLDKERPELELYSDSDTSDAIFGLVEKLPRIVTIKFNSGPTKLPPEALAHLLRLPNVRELYIQNTRLEPETLDALAAFASRGNMDTLNWFVAPVGQREIDFAGKFPTLRWLAFSASEPKERLELGPLARLTNLEALTISNAELTGQLSQLKNLKHLEHLSLKGSTFSDDDLAQLASLTEMCRLDLSGTSITGSRLGELKPLKSMYLLELAGSAITDEGLKGIAALPNLSTLDLEKTGISDAGLDNLAGCKPEFGLKIQLAGTKVTSAGIERLKKAVPDVKVQLSAN